MHRMRGGARRTHDLRDLTGPKRSDRGTSGAMLPIGMATLQFPRRDRYRHRLALPRRGRRRAGAGRLRPVPGPQEAARAELDRAAVRRRVARCRRADARAYRSQRVPAAALQGRVHRAASSVRAARASLLRLLLPDAGFLQEEEARHANKWSTSRHHPALPLYTRADAERCLEQLVPIAFHAPFEPARGVSASFTRAGHIVGSGCLALEVGGCKLTFTGDVGRPADPIMKPPEPLGPTDYLVVESTYGDRRHPTDDIEDALARVIVETVEKRGVLVVPAFAVGRAQHLLHLVARLRDGQPDPGRPGVPRQPDGDRRDEAVLRAPRGSPPVERRLHADVQGRALLATRPTSRRRSIAPAGR